MFEPRDIKHILGPRPPERPKPGRAGAACTLGPAAGYVAGYSSLIIPVLQSLPVSPEERGGLLNGYLRVLSVCRERFDGLDALHEALLSLAGSIQHRYGLTLRVWFDGVHGIAWALCGGKQ
ncbi:MAG: hypothetical protein ACP5QA_14765 [Phycisphaerae bacterium]